MYGDPAQPGTRNAGRGLTIGAFVCAVVALFFVPILFGPAGIVLGILGHQKGDPLGKTAAIVAGVCMVGGMVLGAIVFANRT